MDKLIVIENTELKGARAVVAEVALEGWEDVGWHAVGPASDEPGSTLTADEWVKQNALDSDKTQTTKKEQE